MSKYSGTKVKKLIISQCNFCGSNKHVPVLRHYDNCYYVDKEQYELVECTNCCLAWISNPPAGNVIGRYYPKTSYYSYGTGKSLIARMKRFWLVASLKLPHFISRALLFNDLYFKPRNKSAKSVLDIGCGDGSGLEILRECGFEDLNGTEIDNSVCDLVSKKGINMQCTSDITKIKKNKKYDAIRLNHVLEHVYNPSETLSYIHNLLNDDGSLYVAVPNFGSFAFKLFGKYFCGLQLPTHMFHYNKKVLLSKLEDNGYQIATIKTVGLSGISYSLRTLLLDKYSMKISDKLYLSVALILIPIEIVLNIFGTGFMINIHAVKK